MPLVSCLNRLAEIWAERMEGCFEGLWPGIDADLFGLKPCHGQLWRQQVRVTQSRFPCATFVCEDLKSESHIDIAWYSMTHKHDWSSVVQRATSIWEGCHCFVPWFIPDHCWSPPNLKTCLTVRDTLWLNIRRHLPQLNSGKWKIKFTHEPPFGWLSWIAAVRSCPKSFRFLELLDKAWSGHWDRRNPAFQFTGSLFHYLESFAIHPEHSGKHGIIQTASQTQYIHTH